MPLSSFHAVPARLSPIAVAAHLALLGALASPSAFAQTKPEATLGEVKVLGQSEPAYTVKASSTATKTDTLLRDTPQAITVVTKELMRDQATQSMADVIRYVPGVVTAQGEGNRDTAVFRGNSSTGDFFIDGLRDDVQYYRDFYNIESVEVLKGSNAMIFGRGGSGGVINRVSKQAGWIPVREASLSIGSWNSRRLAADVGQAVNDSVAFRVNGVIDKADSFRNGVTVQRSGINPTLAIRAGASTSITLGYEHFKDDRTADRGIPSMNGKPYDTDPATFFGNAEASYTWARVDAFTATLDHDFGNGMSVRNRTRYADYDKFYQNIFPNSTVNAGKVSIAGYNNATQRSNLFNQTDLMFSLDAGGVKHKLATGLELGRQITDNLRNTAYFPTATSISVPVANTAVTNFRFKPADADANNHGKATVAAVYLQDQIEFSRQWQAIVGVRYDRFSVDLRDQRINPSHTAVTSVEVTDTPLSPRVGLVYKPVEALSLYGSYSVAFVPRAGDQLASITPANKVFDPEKFINVEVGAKWDILPDLAATAALYRLDRNNVLIADPANSTRSILIDGQRSEGLELGLSGNVSAHWSVMGAYAYQDAKLTKDQSKTVKAGAKLAQVPTHTLSVWNRYDFNQQWAGALGVVYRDQLYTALTNTVSLPAFTRLDGAVFYTFSKNLKVQLNVENLLDKKYYASANNDNNISPGSPRALRLTLNSKF